MDQILVLHGIVGASLLDKTLSTSVIFYILHQLGDVVVVGVVKSWWDDDDGSWKLP